MNSFDIGIVSGMVKVAKLPSAHSRRVTTRGDIRGRASGALKEILERKGEGASRAFDMARSARHARDWPAPLSWFARASRKMRGTLPYKLLEPAKEGVGNVGKPVAGVVRGLPR